MSELLHFYKYQGTGNDFVMIDNRNLIFHTDNDLVKRLCDRRFGIGGDGLILLENDAEADFKMVYFNSDGNESTMCGNGGRCIAAFAHMLKIFDNRCSFSAIDGLHNAEIKGNKVKLQMKDVTEIRNDAENFVLNTGSPHFVKYITGIANYDVFTNGRNIRNSEKYKDEGINVNFVEKSGNQLIVRTYERGVEDETYSCGTGVTAAALTLFKEKNSASVDVKVLGGELKVYAEQHGTGFKNIWLEGPAELVYKGEISI